MLIVLKLLVLKFSPCSTRKKYNCNDESMNHCLNYVRACSDCRRFDCLICEEALDNDDEECMNSKDERSIVFGNIL